MTTGYRLANNIVAGVKISTLSQAGQLVVQLVTTLVLVRLLTPEDFGLYGMALVVTGLMSTVRDLGTGAAVIQKQDMSDDLLASLFWANILFGLMAMVMLLLVSPLVAAFYREPRLVSVLGMLSLAFAISGCSVVHQSVLEKNLAFSTVCTIEFVAAAAGAVVAVAAAFLKAGIWCFVWQNLVGAIVSTTLFWLTSHWRPVGCFNWAGLKNVWSFSLNVAGFNLVNFCTRNVDNLLIGRYLGAQSLGQYAVAYRIMLMPLQLISGVVGRVMFPIYATLQGDLRELRRVYLVVVGQIAFVAFPMALMAVMVIEPFVDFFFGPGWEMLPLLVVILAPIGLIQAVSTMNGHLYRAMGRADLQFRVGTVFTVLMITSFATGLRWGVQGVAGAYAIMSLVLFFPSMAIPLRLIELPIASLFRELWRPALAAGITCVLGFVCRMALPEHLPAIGKLAVLLLLPMSSYVVISWVVNRQCLRLFFSQLGLRGSPMSRESADSCD